MLVAWAILLVSIGAQVRGEERGRQATYAGMVDDALGLQAEQVCW